MKNIKSIEILTPMYDVEEKFKPVNFSGAIEAPEKGHWLLVKIKGQYMQKRWLLEVSEDTFKATVPDMQYLLCPGQDYYIAWNMEPEAVMAFGIVELPNVREDRYFYISGPSSIYSSTYYKEDELILAQPPSEANNAASMERLRALLGPGESRIRHYKTGFSAVLNFENAIYWRPETGTHWDPKIGHIFGTCAAYI